MVVARFYDGFEFRNPNKPPNPVSSQSNEFHKTSEKMPKGIFINFQWFKISQK